jgi:hypothetical protein
LVNRFRQCISAFARWQEGDAGHLNSTLPSTFSVIGDPRLNEINGLRWFLC